MYDGGKRFGKLQQVEAIKTLAFCFYWYFIHSEAETFSL